LIAVKLFIPESHDNQAMQFSFKRRFDMARQSDFCLRDIVNRRPLLIARPNNLIREVACKMPAHKTGAAAVLDANDRLIGILTERDIVQKSVAVFRNVDETTVEKIMTPHPVTIDIKSSMSLALSMMTSKGFRHLPVMDGKEVIGILDIRDLYDEMADALANRIKQNEDLLIYAFGEPYGASYSRNTTNRYDGLAA